MSLGLELGPKIVLTDFEVAAMNAYKYNFPRSKIVGCFFHYGQCVFKKILACGIKNQYSSDETFKAWVKSFIALALVPVDKVEDALGALLDSQPDLLRIVKFSDYFVETWIENHVYPLALWNQYKNGEMWTNNHIEGYNLKINKIMRSPHPNVWKFVEKIQTEETETALKYIRIENKTVKTSGRNKKDIQMDLEIAKADI